MGKSRNIAWLESHVDHTGKECLIWPFGRDSDGYGITGIKGRTYNAHRVMCILANGEPPTEKHQASHSCGNGHLACVNPRHLSWKTGAENQLDRATHGTRSSGCRSKLTQEIVDSIRAFGDKLSHREIALRFGVARSNVTKIINGKTWPQERKRRSSSTSFRGD